VTVKTTAQQRINYYLTKAATQEYVNHIATLKWDWIYNLSEESIRLKDIESNLHFLRMGILAKTLAVSTDDTYTISLHGGFSYLPSRSKFLTYPVFNWGYGLTIAPRVGITKDNTIELDHGFDPEQRRIIKLIIPDAFNRDFVKAEMVKLLKVSIAQSRPTTVIRGPLTPEQLLSDRYVMVSDAFYSLGYKHSCGRYLEHIDKKRPTELATNEGFYGFHSKEQVDKSFIPTDLSTYLRNKTYLLISNESELWEKLGFSPEPVWKMETLSAEATAIFLKEDEDDAKMRSEIVLEHLREQGERHRRFLEVKNKGIQS